MYQPIFYLLVGGFDCQTKYVLDISCKKVYFGFQRKCAWCFLVQSSFRSLYLCRPYYLVPPTFEDLELLEDLEALACVLGAFVLHGVFDVK
jgi:hypothetical protein